MIEFSGVSYRYGDTALLSDISLSLPAGSFHFLTGPSGSGKTTFLKLCYLELAPRSGTLTVFGQDSRELDRDGMQGSVKNMPERQEITMPIQEQLIVELYSK